MGKKKKSKEMSAVDALEFVYEGGNKEIDTLVTVSGNDPARFVVAVTTSKSGRVSKRIRINDNPTTQQVAKKILDDLITWNKEETKRRRVAKTTSAVEAVKAWQKKNGVLWAKKNVEAPEEEPTEYTKKFKKLIVTKKAVKKAFKVIYDKADLKKILKDSFPEGVKEVKVKKLMKGLQGVQLLTFDEEKALIEKAVELSK